MRSLNNILNGKQMQSTRLVYLYQNSILIFVQVLRLSQVTKIDYFIANLRYVIDTICIDGKLY